MSAKIRSNPIRPGRDSLTIGTKTVMSTRNARKKLTPRSSIQRGNAGAGFCFDIITPHSAVRQPELRALILGAAVFGRYVISTDCIQISKPRLALALDFPRFYADQFNTQSPRCRQADSVSVFGRP